MSLAGLVDYGSSDESDNEGTLEKNGNKNAINTANEENATNLINSELRNARINDKQIDKSSEVVRDSSRLESEENRLEFDNTPGLLLNSLPMPKSSQIINGIIEDEDDIPVPSLKQYSVEKPPKKEKGPVKISIPSLSDFDDLDEGESKTKIKLQSSKKLPGVLALLPPPKDELISTAKLVPHVLTKTKTTTVISSLTPTQIKNQIKNRPVVKPSRPSRITQLIKSSSTSISDSESEDEDIEKVNNKGGKGIDFFSLCEPVNIPLSEEVVASNLLPMSKTVEVRVNEACNDENDEKLSEVAGKKLTSTVMDLPRDEIILKNKAEVGPKLPVPEQEYNVDNEGNVAFDEKAIEYLCGKRGVKRKNEMINETDIIDINGEDIKPDEREWLVKALTAEPIQRPVSLGSGPSGQSKKKHQITYLAHQAKAMEFELKNQWAANKLARRQSQSKYGFR